MIINLQYLRFFAAFIVILAHANLVMYGIPASQTNLGGVGVDIFFVISGFIMPFIVYGGLYSARSRPVVSPGVFITRRVMRIWPAYLVITFMVLVISFLVNAGAISNATADLAYAFNGSKLDLAWFLQTMTFTNVGKPPLLTIGWTLQYEFIFYCFLTALLVFKPARLSFIEIGSVLVFAAVRLLYATVLSESPVMALLSNWVIAEFFLGLLLYRLVSFGVLFPAWLAVLLIILFTPLYWYVNMNVVVHADYARFLSWGIPAFFLVWTVLSMEGKVPKISAILLLGDASYSLYLSHGIVAPLFVYGWVSYGLDLRVGVGGYLAAYVSVCIAAALLFYKLIERPMGMGFKSLIKKWTVTWAQG